MPRKPLVFIWIISLILFSITCKEQKTGWKGSITTENEVIHVKNLKEPIYAEDIFNLEEELTLGVKEGREEYMFSRICLDVDEEENIYVLDERAQEIRVFNKEGKYMRVIGRKGQGPGEMLGAANYIQVTPQKEVMIYDFRIRHFIFFSLEGKFLRKVSATHISGIPVLFKTDTEGNFIGCLLKPPKQELKKFNSDLEPLFTISTIVNEQRPGGKFGVMGPQLFFAVTRDDIIVWGCSDKYELEFLDLDGKTIKKISKDCTPVEITEEDQERIATRHRTPSNKIAFPKYYPHFRGYFSFFIDDVGKIFVGTYEKNKEGKDYYDVFDAEGKYIAKIPLLITPVVWKRNKMYGIFKDEDGYNFVKRYKVIWKSNDF